MRHRRPSALSPIFAVGALMTVALAPSLVGPVAADHSQSFARGSVQLACSDAGGNLPIDQCVRNVHDSPPGVHAWSVTDAREVRAGGSVMAGNPELRFEETYDGDVLRSISVRGHASVSQEGGGTATADANYHSTFTTTAPITVSGTVSFMATGSSFVNASGGADVRITCGALPAFEFKAAGAAGAGEPLSFATSTPVSASIPGGQSGCTVEVSISAGSGTNQRAPGDQGGSADAEVQLTISLGAAASPTPETCSIAGDVSDTDGTSRPSHSLPRVRVELLRRAADGGAALAPPVATNADGTYCFQLPSGAGPVDAVVRATLIDAARQPSMLQTRHGSSEAPVSTEREVAASEFGRTDVDIVFSPTSDRPWLADVATIHYESERFLVWLLDDLGLAPGLVGPLIMVTGADATNYSFPLKTARISVADTAYAKRADATTECPENCEWHEIAHHVGGAIGLAPTAVAPACAGRTPHGGWTNATTCDSLAEGFASFLSTLGSLDIDRTAGPGYATSDYSVFGNFEDNGHYPWSFTRDDDGDLHYREDHATSELLWDLADAAGDEHESLWSAGDPSDINPLQVYDRVDLGGRNFVHILAASQAHTVMDLYDFLVASPDVPADLKERDPGFPEALAQDITPLQEVFLLHRFYPVPDPIDPDETPLYHFGDTIGRTDRPGPSGGEPVDRRDVEAVSGSEIRLVNDGDAPATFTIEIAYPNATSRRDVVVQPRSERLVHVEVPAPWPGIMKPDDPLPACSANPPAQHRVVTVKVSGPAGVTQSMDNCAYLHAVATTTTGHAMSVAAAGSGEAVGPTTTLVIAVAVAGVLLLLGALVIWRRRKPGGATPAA